MTQPGFETSPQRLPASLSIFPLQGVLLLPRGRLPLNIFEPRYINMIDDALAGDRMIGIIQPCEPDPSGTNPPVFKTGCAGRLTSFAEEGTRYLITLTGVCRFDVTEEVTTMRGYRRVVPDWAPYLADFNEVPQAAIDRPRLVASLKTYFKVRGITADWQAIEAAPDDRLVTSLAMICPFGAAEKQSLLQTSNLAERTKMLIGLVEMAVLEHSGDSARH
jgi:Lon protease-like protein